MEWRKEDIEQTSQELDKFGSECMEKRAEVEQLDTEISEKESIKARTEATLAEKQDILDKSLEKVVKINTIDHIETGKTVFGGKVTISPDDYDRLTDLAKKQIAAESREGELTAEVTKLRKENEEVIEKNAILEQKVQKIYPLKEALRKAENELSSIKAKYQKVMDFIEGLKLTQKLQEFLERKNIIR